MLWILVSGEVSHSWVLDLGALLHVTPHREWFTSYESGNHGTISLGDSYECDIVSIGDICMILPNGTQFKIEKVCHVPRLTRNLLSVGMLDDIGYKVSFINQSWKISKGNLNIASGSKIDSLYPLYVSCKNDLLSVNELPNVSLWHSRLGHMSRKQWKIFRGWVICLHYLSQIFHFVSIACMKSKLGVQGT